MLETATLVYADVVVRDARGGRDLSHHRPTQTLALVFRRDDEVEYLRVDRKVGECATDANQFTRAVPCGDDDIAMHKRVLHPRH